MSLRKRKKREPDLPVQDGDLHEPYHYPFEESGMVGDPVPQRAGAEREAGGAATAAPLGADPSSDEQFAETAFAGISPKPSAAAPSKQPLSQTGEIRLAQLTDEVRREAEKLAAERGSSSAQGNDDRQDVEGAQGEGDPEGRGKREASAMLGDTKTLDPRVILAAANRAGVQVAGMRPDFADSLTTKAPDDGEPAQGDAAQGGADGTAEKDVPERAAQAAAQGLEEDEPPSPSNDGDDNARHDGPAPSPEELFEQAMKDEVDKIPVLGGAYAVAGQIQDSQSREIGETEDAGQEDFAELQGKYAHTNQPQTPRSPIQFSTDGSRQASSEAPDQAGEQPRAEEEAKPGNSDPDLSGFTVLDPSVLSDLPDGEVVVRPRELLSASTYDDLINWGSRLARETPLFRRAFSLNEAKTVCDVGCGSGRHTVLFAQWGMQATGVETSSAMIKRARAYAAEFEGEIVQAGGSAMFRKSSLGHITSTVGHSSVDALCCVGDVLPRVETIKDLRLALFDFAQALAPSGVLVLEFANHARYALNRVRTTRPVTFDTTQGTKVFLSVMDYPSGAETIGVDMLTLTCGADSRWHVRCERARNLILTENVIARELLDAGFDVLEVSGDYAGRSLDVQEDESVIVIARRKAHLPQERNWPTM